MTKQKFRSRDTGWQGTRSGKSTTARNAAASWARLIEAQRAAGTAEAEHVLALEASDLQVLEDMLASGGPGLER